MIRTALKVGVLAAAVAAYAQPQLLLQPLFSLEPDDADADALARVVRAVMTLCSYALATFRPSWFWVVVAVAALQILLWGLQLSDSHVLDVGVLGEDGETNLFLLGAVLCFAAITSIILFGGGSDAKERFRERLIAFYETHNPEKLDEVNELVAKYEANEDLLFERLHRKYNALAAGAKSKSVMKNIDESSFLYEESEEEAELPDEEAQEKREQVYADRTEEAFIQPQEVTEEPQHSQEQHEPARSQSSGSSESDDGFQVVKSVPAPISIAAEAEIDEEVQGTPPVSPRSAEMLAHKRRQSSALIAEAIAQARAAQQARIEQRIANLASRKGDGYAGH